MIHRTRSTAAVLLAAALLVPASASAQFKGRAGLETGYRIDSLAWDIGSNGGPNVLSELSWRDERILELRGRAEAENDHGVYAKASLSYGWIIHGRNRDSDFDGSDRTQEFSRSDNLSNGAYVWDSMFGLGYDFHPAPAWSLIPLIGYAASTQKFIMKGGFQTIGDGVRVPLPGPIQGLNSSYKADWWGPWNGVDVAYAAGRLRLSAGAEYHWATSYSGTGDWNLRALSFTHTARHGHGVVARGSLSYALDERWGLRGEGVWRRFRSGVGSDISTIAGVPVGNQPFNDARWTSASGSVGVEYRF